MFRKRFYQRNSILFCICVLAFLGCETGEIQNFEGIQVLSEPRLDRLAYHYISHRQARDSAHLESKHTQSKRRC